MASPFQRSKIMERPSSLFTSIRVPVAGVPCAETPFVAGWVFAPPMLLEHPRVVVCYPGASYTKAYYHLEVPGCDSISCSINDLRAWQSA